MRLSTLSFALFGCASLWGGLSSPASAHHSRAPYDLDSRTDLQVTITRVRWGNPHIYIEADDASSGASWLLEGHSVSGMLGNGWRKDSVKPGDRVRAVVNAAKDGGRSGLIHHIALPDGKTFYAFQKPPIGSSQPRRVPDNRVQPSTDFAGNWNYTKPLAGILVFKPPNFDAVPLTEKGKAAAAAFDPNDSPAFRCEEVGLPHILSSAYQTRWLRHADRIVIEKQQASRDIVRNIWVDGRKRPASEPRSVVGFSRGRFEEDGALLIIETGHFAETPWGLMPGIPSSQEKTLTERYRLINGGLRMLIEYELNDPVYLSEPLRFVGVYDKRPNAPFVWEPCDVEAARAHLVLER